MERSNSDVLLGLRYTIIAFCSSKMIDDTKKYCWRSHKYTESSVDEIQAQNRRINIFVSFLDLQFNTFNTIYISRQDVMRDEVFTKVD